MLRARHFRVDPRRVVHETIDGETILIDLNTGTYYSLVGSGPEIWGLLVEGWPDINVTREMERRYADQAEAAGGATADMIEQLHREGLLAEVEPNGKPLRVAAADTALDKPFEPPVLERYTDMQYFLLLDPIHEVEDAGWPHAPAPAPPQAWSS